MATITAAAGGGNWNVGSTWVGGVVPLTTDNVVLNATSGQVTITATAQCVNINFTGYTNTITFNANLTITGDLTRSASVFSYAGTFGIIIAGTTTQIITTSSVAWTIPVTFGGASPNISINGAFNITAPLTLSSTTSPVIARANVFDLTENVYPSNNITISGNGTYTGSANIVVSGSNNQTLTASGSHQIRNNLTIDKTGGVLTLSGTLNYNTGTLAYVASGGTVNAGSSTLNIGASATLNTNGITWNNISAGLTFSNPTITLSSNLTWSGTMSLINNTLSVSGATRTVTFSGSSLTSLPTANIDIGNTGFGSNGGASIINFPSSTVLSITNLNIGCGGFASGAYNTSANNVTFNISGNLTLNTSNPGFGAPRFNGASSQINMVGNSIITNNRISGTSIYIAIPTFTINTPNTVTFSSNDANTVYFESSTITYTSGTLTGATCAFITSTLNLNAGGQWGTNVTIRGATTLTSNATFGNLTTDTTTVTFSGAFTINVKGNLAINITTSGASTPIVLNGTGNQSWTHGSAVNLSNNLTINKASGTLTVGSVSLPNVYYLTGTLTYNNIGGTVDAATTLSTLNIGGTTILNTNGINWYRISVNAAATITLTSNLNVTNRATYQNGTITHAGGGLLNLTGELSCGSFTASTNVTFPNADLNVTNLLINISALNFNTTVNNGVNNIYISGNYTLANNNNSAWYGITCSPIIFNGSGTQTWTHTTTGTAFVYHVGKVTINTTGTLVFGSNIFWGGNTFQYIQGIVNQNNKSLYIFQSSSLNLQGTTDNLIIENLDTIGQVTGNITLLSDIYCQNANLKYATTFGMSGNFKLTCNNLVVAETTLVSTGTFNVPANNIYVNNLTLNGRTAGGAINCTGGKFYVNGNFNANGGTFENNFAYYGSEIILTGSGNFATTYGISNPITFDTSGTIRITSTYFFFGSNEAGTSNPVRMTLKYLRGNIIADKTILYLARVGFNGASVPQLYELINIHKIVFKEVFIASSRSGVPNDIIMNEFFNGSPTVKTKVQAITTGVNYVVNFTDNFEKIAKFVDVSGCTLLKPQQLLLLTNMKKSSTNTRGIRYNNQSPNGSPKNDPSVQNQMTYSVPKYLVGDPNMIKSM